MLAVDRLDLDVREGDVYGFLGANGSGKTTTVRMLLGLVLATSGSIEVMGRPMPRSAREVLPHVGALVEGPGGVPPPLRPRQPGAVRRHGSRRVRGAAAPAGSTTRSTRWGSVAWTGGRCATYSLGMRQRLGLALALLRQPRLLVLDEPTNGLDPQGIHEVRDLLLELNASGTTVFLSSHLLSEVGHLCSRVGVLDGGRMVVQEELAVLLQPTGRVVLTTPEPDAARALLDGRVDGSDGERLVVRDADPASLNARLVAGGVPVTSLAEERRTLEDVVLEASRPGSDRWSRVMIAVELRKMLLSRRTWVTILLIDALPTLVAILLAVTDLGPRPGTGPAFLSAVMTDGSLFPLAALGIVLPLFLPIAVALTAGEAIAGEGQQGTLRYVLVRPVGRTRLLVAKLVAVMSFVVVTVLVVAVDGVRHRHPAARPGEPDHRHHQHLRLEHVDPGAGRAHHARAGLRDALHARVAAIALFLSTVTESPLGAALGCLAVLIASTLLLTLEAADPLKPYLLTRHWLAFVDLFRDPILWRDVLRGALLQGVYVVVFLAAGWANFTTKDVTV